MSSEVLPIGSLTFLINSPKAETVDDRDLQESEVAVVDEFRRVVESHGLADRLSVLSSSASRGCITVTIVIGLAAPIGAYVLIKDYEKLRSSILLIAKDVGTAHIALKKWVSARRVWFFKEDIDAAERIKQNEDRIKAHAEKFRSGADRIRKQAARGDGNPGTDSDTVGKQGR